MMMMMADRNAALVMGGDMYLRVRRGLVGGEGKEKVH